MVALFSAAFKGAVGGVGFGCAQLHIRQSCPLCVRDIGGEEEALEAARIT